MMKFHFLFLLENVITRDPYFLMIIVSTSQHGTINNNSEQNTINYSKCKIDSSMDDNVKKFKTKCYKGYKGFFNEKLEKKKSKILNNENVKTFLHTFQKYFFVSP